LLESKIASRAGRIEIFTAPVLCRVSYRVLDINNPIIITLGQ